MNMRLVRIVGAILFATSTIFATLSELQFTALKQSAGIKSLAMAGTGVSSPEGAERVSVNPATLGIPGFQYSYSNRDYSLNEGEEARLGLTGASHQLYWSPFGLAFTSIEDKDGNKVETTRAAFGRRNRNGLNWGLAYKLINVSDTGQSQEGVEY